MISDALTVILGAGSSYDCASDSVAEVEQSFRPPLTRDLFAATVPFSYILHKYRRAEALSDEIRIRIAQGENVESILIQTRLVKLHSGGIFCPPHPVTPCVTTLSRRERGRGEGHGPANLDM